MTSKPMNATGPALDPLERRIIEATQGGLPIVAEPWQAVADGLGVPLDELLTRLADMLQRGVIRRIGAVPNHYAIGYTANGMSVWDVDDAQVAVVGEFVGRLDRVTHCYQRPRALPDWPYNLFAMVHGQDRDEVREHIEQIAVELKREFGPVCQARDVLFSSAILKKTGLRIGMNKSTGKDKLSF